MTRKAYAIAALAYAAVVLFGAMTFAPVWAPACAAEDSAWCFWDARARGSGAGSSFLSTWEGGPVFYLPQG